LHFLSTLCTIRDHVTTYKDSPSGWDACHHDEF